MMKKCVVKTCSVILLLVVFATMMANAQEARRRRSQPVREFRGFPAHDPVMIKQDSVYYLFTTGNGISVASSTDMKNWTRLAPVFSSKPEWITEEIVPGFRGNHLWAPDISFVNGTYYLYYSASAFAKNTSAIGVATNKTLHPSDPDFKWVDHGMVVHSVPNRDFWNAIDPNLIMAGRNEGWLAFGSFWGGLKLVKLSPDLLSLAQPEEWYTIARQPRTFALDDTDPGDGAIEAPFIYRHYQYYYLFVSVDYCCRGLDSTYKILVGRSRNVEGPYVDKDGVLLSRGGGTLVAEGNEDWAAVGHCSAYMFDGKSYLVFHGYDRRDNGRSKLIIREIKWDGSDWPSIDL